MGYPLRANIFRSGTLEQRYFAKFPIQVAVLFSPSDKAFSEAFRSLFIHLDILTGERVAFFAVIDPPRDWLIEAKKRTWWKEYQGYVGTSGFTVDEDRALASELARMFNVTWSELPVLIASTNLWNAEFAVLPTSQSHIEKQLTVLTDLAKQWGAPTLDQIVQSLEDELGDYYRFYPADLQKRLRFNQVYDILDTLEPNFTDPYRIHPRFWRLARAEVKTSMAILDDIYQNTNPRLYQDIPSIGELDYAYAEANGHLIIPASVAAKANQLFVEPLESDIIDRLEEEAQIMIDTAQFNGGLLNKAIAEGMRDIHKVDFGGIASEIWRAFELEVNFSLIQAGRKGRSIRMPEDFIRYVPNFPKEKSMVQTGTKPNGDPIRKDINAQNKERKTTQHKFLTLGDSWHIVEALRSKNSECFDHVLAECGVAISLNYMDKWKQMFEIRNPVSHVEILSYDDYRNLLKMAYPEMFVPLVKVKQALRQ